MDLVDSVLLYLGYDDDPEMKRKIKLNIDAIREFLMNAGANEDVIVTDLGIVCISLGVNDLMNSSSGEAKFSPSFYTIANQLCRK